MTRASVITRLDEYVAEERLLAAIAVITFGTPFTVVELQQHAAVNKNLAALLAEHSNKSLGKLLARRAERLTSSRGTIVWALHLQTTQALPEQIFSGETSSVPQPEE